MPLTGNKTFKELFDSKMKSKGHSNSNLEYLKSLENKSTALHLKIINKYYLFSIYCDPLF